MLGRRRGLKGGWLEVSSLASWNGGVLYVYECTIFGGGKSFSSPFVSFIYYIEIFDGIINIQCRD